MRDGEVFHAKPSTEHDRGHCRDASCHFARFSGFQSCCQLTPRRRPNKMLIRTAIALADGSGFIHGATLGAFESSTHCGWIARRSAHLSAAARATRNHIASNEESAHVRRFQATSLALHDLRVAGIQVEDSSLFSECVALVLWSSPLSTGQSSRTRAMERNRSRGCCLVVVSLFSCERLRELVVFTISSKGLRQGGRSE